jgi:hypothetical protein
MFIQLHGQNCYHNHNLPFPMFKALSTRCILIIFLLLAALYGPFLNDFYCGHDDYMELYRSRFLNAGDVSTIVTKSHFNSFKYRPLSHAFVFVSEQWAGGSPWLPRLRNILFHGVCAWLLYLLTRRFGFGLSSLGAMAFFALHPLTNQVIEAASWTNTMANSCYLATLLFGLRYLQPGRRWFDLALCSFFLLCGLLFYDGALMAPPTLLTWFLWYSWRQRKLALPLGNLIAASVTLVLPLVVYWTLRTWFVPKGQQIIEISPLATLLLNLGLYFNALLIPLDPVLLNAAIDFPLPSRSGLNELKPLLLASGILGLALVAGLVLSFRQLARQRERQSQPLMPPDTDAMVCLSVAGVISLMPFLLFSALASETYLYLPLALFGAVLVSGLSFILRTSTPPEYLRRTAIALAVVWIAYCSTAVVTRNFRVGKCGMIAENILRTLPGQWRDGKVHHGFLAPAPYSLSRQKYGLYAYSGLDTIGGNWTDAYAMQGAVRFYLRNENLNIQLGREGQLSKDCRSKEFECFWVDSDGTLLAPDENRAYWIKP